MSVSVIIRVHSLANGMTFSKDLWVHSFEPEVLDRSKSSHFMPNGDVVINGAYGGQIILTPVRNEAKRYDGSAEAMAAWNTISFIRPRRPDGRPNKPMTVLTVEVEPE